MFQIIAGEKGKGKTKLLIKNANDDVYSTNGSLVYIDKSNKHMYELSNKIRLINSKEYFITNSDEFLGFMCGVISQDHDVEKVYFDSFLKIACIKQENLETILTKLKNISNHFHVDFLISISMDQEDIPSAFWEDVVISL